MILQGTVDANFETKNEHDMAATIKCCCSDQYFVQCSQNTKEGLQRISAVFVACCRQFAASYPAEFVEQELQHLRAGFFRLIQTKVRC